MYIIGTRLYKTLRFSFPTMITTMKCITESMAVTVKYVTTKWNFFLTNLMLLFITRSDSLHLQFNDNPTCVFHFY